MVRKLNMIPWIHNISEFIFFNMKYRMFKSRNFEKTRGFDRGESLDISHFTNQFEVTDICENIDMDQYNRQALKNYGPDRILFESEQPRRNTWGRQMINLHHDGAYTTEMPWRNEAYDLQFHDPDARNKLDFTDFRIARRVDEPKLRQRWFGYDNDHSVPGQGIAGVDMVSRISEIRRQMRGWQWFSESQDNFAIGRWGHHPNTPRDGKFVGTGGVDMVVPEDSSATVDPAILDTIGRQGVNRLVSNNIHMGGRYFIDRTTPDHVVPTAAYGFLFRSAPATTPRQSAELVIGDQPIRTLADPLAPNKRHIMAMLDGRAPLPVAREHDRYNHMLERQMANSEGRVLTSDIMALMGVTANEIRYINSMESTNRNAYRQCMANVVDMVVALDKLPPNAKLDIRARLLSARTPTWRGGTCQGTITTNTVRPILESRTAQSKQALNGTMGTGTILGNRFGQSMTTAPTVGTSTSGTQDTVTATATEHRPGQSIVGTTTTPTAQDWRGGDVGRQTVEPTADYSRIFQAAATRQSVVPGYNHLPTEANEDAWGQSMGTMGKNCINTKDQNPSMFVDSGDTAVGLERVYEGPLVAWNDSHLIPQQLKR